MPTVTAPTYSNGQKQRSVGWDCPTTNATFQTGSISYAVSGVLWDPPLPSTVTNSFSSTAYVNLSSSDSNLCAGGRVNIGTASWTVSCNLSHYTTNCTPGQVILTNGTITTNVCIGSQVSATIEQVLSNAIQVITSNYTNACGNPDTNCPATKITNSIPPTIVSNWWTASVGTFTTNGSGTSAAFVPTNCGNGTITFYARWQNGCTTNTTDTSKTKNFVVRQTKITFDDTPSRLTNDWPVTWMARLEAVCVTGTNNVSTNYSTTYTSLASLTWGFSINANGVVTMTNSGGGTPGQVGVIVVTGTTANNGTAATNSVAGMTLEAYYIGCCENGTLNWVQTITATSHPLGGNTPPYNDAMPGQAPYYFGWPGSSGVAWDLISNHTTVCP